MSGSLTPSLSASEALLDEDVRGPTLGSTDEEAR